MASAGALAIGAGVVGALAVKAKSDYNAAIGRFGVTAGEVASDRSQTRGLSLAADVLGGAAVGVAAVTVMLRLWAAPPAAGDTSQRMSLEPSVCPGGARIGMRVQF
jgi:hypothetical protein